MYGSATHWAEAQEGGSSWSCVASSQISLSSELPLRTLKYIYVAQVRLNSLNYIRSWNGLKAPLANYIYFCLYKLARSYYCVLALSPLQVPSSTVTFMRDIIFYIKIPGQF